MTQALNTLFERQRHSFIGRHIGPDSDAISNMLKHMQLDSLDELIAQSVPEHIRKQTALDLESACSEEQALSELTQHAQNNTLAKSYIGMGYYPCHTPNVIQRNILENPGWYTAYTPYQPEISQGRLEALLNYQHMVMDLTGMDLANASLLDEGTAAAEAMTLCKRSNRKNKSPIFFIDKNAHPQTIAVVRTRARNMGIELEVGELDSLSSSDYFAALIQYPGSNGEIPDLQQHIAAIHANNAQAVIATDLLSLALLTPPGELGADVVLGNSQRFGVPMGCGGPHAAFFATKDKFKRSVPGRIIGQSVDSREAPALRMALQTREQHIRREKATSNICTAQALLAIMASFYAVYHGPAGIVRIAQRVNQLTALLANTLQRHGIETVNKSYFDTLCLAVGDQQQAILERASEYEINLRQIDEQHIGLSLDETTVLADVEQLIHIISGSVVSIQAPEAAFDQAIPEHLRRRSDILQHPVFNRYHSETEMMRYMSSLERKDIALNRSMIALGSCTMKLNPSSAMQPIGWPEFAHIHPFAPHEQLQGYAAMCDDLERWLAACTGYDAVSLQPNAGSQGEYAGLLAIKRYHAERGEAQRNICLIPSSAHGTNPASAAMVDYKIVIVACDDNGNVDIEDLQTKIEQHGDQLAAIMVTYPSTHGVFEEDIRTICKMIHDAGGQVYVDGANLNAMVGLAEPGEFGADVSHLNLHKTFAIPHGGGGPGMGPIGVKAHLQEFLPAHPISEPNADVVSAAPWGSASILPISWMYIRMLGREGLTQASKVAILNANYVAHRLEAHFPVLYKGRKNRVAHECIIDLRPLKERSGISEEDIAKRLMDYGFHAPTMSFPVAGTLMIEPTESESLTELERFCDAFIRIRKEIDHVIDGTWPADNNPLVNAPHSHNDLLDWSRPYSIETAFFPQPEVRENKYWPPVNRVDNVYGDRNFCCSLSLDDYASAD